MCLSVRCSVPVCNCIGLRVNQRGDTVHKVPSITVLQVNQRYCKFISHLNLDILFYNAYSDEVHEGYIKICTEKEYIDVCLPF